MELTSLYFFIFVIIVGIFYFFVPKKFQWIVLLIANILFFNKFTVEIIINILWVLLISYFGGILIEKNITAKRAKNILIICIALILLQLFCFKYINLFIGTYGYLFKIKTAKINLISSVGISYYSLIMISYLVDIYWGIVKPQKNIFKCALFMTYFPILTSGPFIKYEDMNKKLYEKHKFDYNRFCSGVLRSLWGIFKVLVLSQRLSLFVDTVYMNYVEFNGFYIVLAILFFPLQLYANFSGSIDIIMGISEVFGINLPENFNRPFFSKSITEFWRRWHITLGEWLKIYIFYPLMKSNFIQKIGNKFRPKFGKKVYKKVCLYFSMLIMWILIGIWHGGKYTYIISSGVLQFCFVFLEDILTPLSNKINAFLKINTKTFSYKLYQCIRTYLLFSFSMIFFRAISISYAFDVIKNIFVFNPYILFDNMSLYSAGLDFLDFRIVIISLIVLFTVELLQRNESVRKKLFKQNIVFRWSIIFMLLFAIIIFGCYGPGYDPTTFIYRNF